MSNISSFSSATGMNKKDEEIQKLKVELQQIKDAANSNQFGGLLMMQIGEKFGKIVKEIDGLKSENRVDIQAFEELKAQMIKMTEAFEGLKATENEENSAFEELKEEFEKMAEENVGLKESVEKLVEENVEMKKEMSKMKAAKDEEKAELEGLKEEVNKMKEEFSVKNSELEAQIDGLKKEGQKLEDKMRELQEQQKMDKETFVQLNKNKWNAADCGPKLIISGEGGLVVKHLGGQEWNCIRAILPIPAFDSSAKNPSIAGYFEAQIGGMNPRWIRFDTIVIGFCSAQFPLEGKWLGEVENSIGIFAKNGMYINGEFKEFGNGGGDFKFKVEDVIGTGVIHSPANSSMKCFGTLNGQLLGTLELPDNFSTLQLFPAAGLFDVGNSIVVNFGQEKWRYDPSELLK